MEGKEPAREVHHLPDNTWAIADGVDDPNECPVVAMHLVHLVDRDPTLAALASLPIGRMALRSTPSDDWQFADCTYEDDS